ncbi:uncharacterized protein J3D65DRAFT_160201 [Phyllosticta citribraziliensis]|uniref:Uncharacterized protein n=1 Tax=Phyllosticta citribraziliensis TaxID=989973 RepID=A0ABR1L3P3_9PEZI
MLMFQRPERRGYFFGRTPFSISEWRRQQGMDDERVWPAARGEVGLWSSRTRTRTRASESGVVCVCVVWAGKKAVDEGATAGAGAGEGRRSGTEQAGQGRAVVVSVTFRRPSQPASQPISHAPMAARAPLAVLCPVSCVLRRHPRPTRCDAMRCIPITPILLMASTRPRAACSLQRRVARPPARQPASRCPLQ